MLTAEERQTFERLPREPVHAFHAFAVHYRDAGVARSLDKAWHAHWRQCVGTPQPTIRRRPMRWGDWSVTWAWVSRAQAYDRHIEATKRAAFEREQVAASRQHARVLHAAVAALAVPLRLALAVTSTADDLTDLIAAAGLSAGTRRQALADARSAAQVLPSLVMAERAVLGLATALEVRRDVAGGDPLALTIAADPALTQAAVELLDAVSRRTLPPKAGA